MSDNNNHPPDRNVDAEKNQPLRKTSSGSISSTGSTSSANAPFTFGATSTGLQTSQAEPLRFGSHTVPGFGASNVPAFGQTPATVAVSATASATASAPVTTQPFQFGGAGSNAFQFGSSNTNTSASGFQFGASTSNANFGFGSSANQGAQTTGSPFQFGTSNTSNTTAPFGGSSAFGSTPANADPFGTSTHHPQTSTATAASPFTFGAAPKRQETIQIDDDDDDANNNNASKSPPNKAGFSFGSTPPKKEGSGSSSSSTPLQQKQQRQQASEFFSIVATESSAAPSSPFAFVSPGSTEEINIKKPSTQPTFTKEDDSKTSHSHGATLAHLEDPFNSAPIQKTAEPQTRKDGGSPAVVIEALDEDDEEEEKDESRNQVSEEPFAQDKEYQVEEPEEANVESENEPEKDDTVEVSTESVEQARKSEGPSEADKSDGSPSSEAAPIEIIDSSDEDELEEEEYEEETIQASDEAKEEDQEKQTESSSFATTLFSNVSTEKSKTGDSEEPKKSTPLFSGFNFTSQSTSTSATASNKPPPIIFGNAGTATPNTEKPPAFTGFNFGGEAAKLTSTISPFGNIQFPPKDNTFSTSERAGGAIKKKRASKIGVPYDTGKSSAKQADNPLHEISAPTPVLPGFNFGTPASSSGDATNTGEKKAEKPSFPGFNFGSVSSKSPIVEEGPKETAQAPSVPRFPSKPTAPAITDKVQTSKNPFAGINFSSRGSENTTQVTANIGKEIKAPGSSYGSIIPVGESKGSPFGVPASQTSDHAGSSPFAFGSTGATFGASDKPPSLTAFAGFGDKTPSFGGAATDKSKETSTPSGFTFGASGDTSKEKTNTPSLSFDAGSSIGFGANTDKETKDTSKVSPFTFGGAASTETSKASPFTFGGAASTETSKDSSKASPFTFGGAASTETSKEPSKTSPFIFGGASSTETPKDSSKTSPFTFGGAASSSATKEIIKAPAFSFGNTGDKNKESVDAPSFSFGNTSDKAKESNKTPTFSFGSAGDAAKEAAQASNAPRYSLDKNPFALSTNKAMNASNASNAPNFNFSSNFPSTEKSNDSGSPIFRFGASETSAPTAGSSGVSQERSNKKKRQLDSDEEDGPPASKKSHFNIQMPSTPSSSSSSNTKKRQLDDSEETPVSNKKTSAGFTTATPPAGNMFSFGAKAKEDTSKEDQGKENQSPSYTFGANPEGGEEETPKTSEKPTSAADILPKSVTAAATPAVGALTKKPSPLSKEITFAAKSKSSTPKNIGSVAIAFSKKDVIENETLNIKPVKLISSELSAEIGTLKSDMISFSDEVLQTRFWQLSPEVQQNMTAFDAFVNAHIENFKRFEKSRRPGLKDTLADTTQKIKALSMDTENLSKMQEHITTDVEVFKKRVALQKGNVNAAKEYKTQTNIYLQERDEKINWQYINHMAGEMESRLEEYQQVIPSMEESISNMRADASVSDINNAIDDQGKILVKLAGKTAKIHDDVHTIRLRRTPQ